MLSVSNYPNSAYISFKSARISPETRSTIFKMLNDGAGVTEISKELKIAKSTVRLQIKKSNFSGSVKSAQQEIRFNNIIELLNQGNSLKSASEKLGISAATARRILDVFSPKIDLLTAKKEGIVSEITQFIKQGLTIDEIAGKLKCSTYTVDDYIQKY